MASEALQSLRDQLENISASSTQSLYLRGDGIFVDQRGTPVSTFTVLAALHELQQFVGRVGHLSKAIHDR